MLICSLILNAKLKIIAHQATYLIKKEDNTTVGRDGIFLLLLNWTLNLFTALERGVNVKQLPHVNKQNFSDAQYQALTFCQRYSQ